MYRCLAYRSATFGGTAQQCQGWMRKVAMFVLRCDKCGREAFGIR